MTCTFDEHDFSVSRRLAHEIPVFLSHDPHLEIGKLRQLTPQRDWWDACFEIEPRHGIELDVGQNVSVDLQWRADEPDAPRLGELSLVRRGRVPGGAESIPWKRPAEQTHKTPALAAPVASDLAHARRGEVIHGGRLIRRNLGTVLRAR